MNCSLSLYLQNNQTHQVIPIQYVHAEKIKKGMAAITTIPVVLLSMLVKLLKFKSGTNSSISMNRKKQIPYRKS